MPSPIPDRERRRVLLWVFAVALLARLVYLAHHSGSALFAFPLLDGKYYETAARLLLEGGDPTAIGGAFRPWLYPAFLALCHAVAGGAGNVLALVLQHVFGAATALFVAWLALAIYRRPAAGWSGGLLYALAPPPLFFEGELLITSLFTLLVTGWLVVMAGERGRRPWIAGGLLLALAAQARPNVLVLVLAYVALLVIPERWLASWHMPTTRGAGERSSLAETRRGAGIALVALLAGLMLAAWLQRPLWGEWQLLPSSGGINLYLGNGAAADGMVPRQDRWVTYGEEYRDSVEVFATAEHRRLNGLSADEDVPSATVSRFWVGRTLDEISEQPERWLSLMLRKTLYLVWNHEIPNNLGFEFFRRHEVPWLSWLPVRWWMLLTLALPGLLLAWRAGDRRRLFWLLAWLVLGSLAVLAFFVNSRYRIPLWPALAVLAAGGGLELADTLRRAIRSDASRRMRVRALALVVSCAVVASASLLDRPWAEPEHPERDFFFRSLARQQRGDLEGAEADARRSLELAADQPAAHFQLASVAMALENDELAYRSLRRAAELAPDEPRIYNDLAVLAEKRGQVREAYRGYVWALAVSRDTYAPAMVNAALLELRAGYDERAAQLLERAEASGFEAVSFDCARAFLAARRGEVEEARHWLEEAEAKSPETTARLVREHQQAIDPAMLDLGRAP